MDKNIFSATGRRKESTARATLREGKGNFSVNGLEVLKYLKRQTLVDHAKQPLLTAEMMGKLDIECKTSGGGLTGQAGAIRLAIARALLSMNPELRKTLGHQGLLTRDAREVERKKYGQPKARKRFQYSKR